MPKWVIILAVVVVGYFAWRKFGDQVKDTVSNLTS